VSNRPASQEVSRPAWQVATLLFGSGLCALVYQTVWFREFRLIFGASTAAAAAVLAIFMGGLGLGSWWLGRRADRQGCPLAFYGWLEAMIAASAATTPVLIWLVRGAYSQTGGSVVLGDIGAAVVRLLLAAMVLFVPTFAMGGTLPVAARAAVRSSDTGRRELALLYTANTLGAVVGALLGTFFLLEKLGNRGCLWLACAVNAGIALTAILLGRADDRPAAERGRQPISPCRGAERAEGRTIVTSREGAGFVFWAAGLSGLAFFLMELVWYRMLSPLLGGSVFTFGLILATALLGVGLGGAIYSAWTPCRWVTLRGLAISFSLEALCIAVPFALGDQTALLALDLRRWVQAGFLANALGWGAVTALVVLPAAVVAGFQFPLLIALLGQGRDRVGDQVGRAYAWNTGGAIAGALAGGFGLLPLLTAPGAWRLTVLLLACASLGALVAGKRQATGLLDRATPRRRPWLLPLGLAGLASLLVVTGGPTSVWRHSGIGAGRSDSFSRASAAEVRDQARLWRRALLWEEEGRESNVALIADKGISFLINGKNDGSARGDAGTMIMSGLMGPLLAPAPRHALVIGLGTGMTAGWLGQVPSVTRVDVLELEPAVRRVAEACAAVNAGAMQNPKVQLWYGDARELLMVLPGQYDLMTSEPSNPFRAGVASLFTREFYRAALQKLTPGGLFLQWVQAYEVDAPTIQTACATLASVFPVVETWATQAGDLLFVGARQPLVCDVPAWRSRIREEPLRSALAQAWRVTDLEGVLAHFLGSDELSRTIAATPGLALNTDDHTVMEFNFARTVAVREPFDTRHWLALAQARQADRPAVTGGAVDWDQVAERRASWYATEGVDPPLAANAGPELRQRTLAKSRYAQNDLQGALEAWCAQSQAPSDLTEAVLLAECLADTGEESALAHLVPVRAWHPIEAEAILARLRWRQARWEESVTALEAALTPYRTNAWPWPPLMYRALGVAQQVSLDAKAPGLARRLHALLGRPFAVRVWEQLRLACRFNIALDTRDAGLLRESIEAFEPHVPWQRPFLEKRAGCYRFWNDPRAYEAGRDLAAFDRLARALETPNP